MKDSNELFELCKQVYEATGWDDTKNVWSLQHTGSVEEQMIKEEIGAFEYSREPTECLRMGQPVLAPYYTSDYLLEKLPYKIGKANSAIWLRLGKTRNSYTVCYMGSDLVCIYDFEADTPLKALLKLTLKLHEDEIL